MRHTHTHLHDQQRTLLLHHVMWTYIYGNFVKIKMENWFFSPIILQMWQKDKKQNKPKLPKGDLWVMSTYHRGDFHVLLSSHLYQFSSNKFHLKFKHFSVIQILQKQLWPIKWRINNVLPRTANSNTLLLNKLWLARISSRVWFSKPEPDF